MKFTGDVKYDKNHMSSNRINFIAKISANLKYWAFHSISLCSVALYQVENVNGDNVNDLLVPVI